MLNLTGWAFSVCSSSIAETPHAGEAPDEVARRLAVSKAQAARAICSEVAVTLAADTMVVHQKKILGKPVDVDEAVSMLQDLQGQSHEVITAVALDTGEQIPRIELCETSVPMREYRQDEIEEYIRGGSPFDKAGAYGIQDPDFHPVDLPKFTGCFANVMGLPLCHLVRAFRKLGYEPPEDVPHRCKQFTGYDCTIYPTILRSTL